MANTRLAEFERMFLPHLDAAYNLARWLMRNEQDAEDVVQEAYLRAFKFFESFQGTGGKAWLLAIVRNTCRTGRQSNAGMAEFDEVKHSSAVPDNTAEQVLLKRAEIDGLRACIDALPAEYREVIVLRELEELSYKDIAEAAAVPLGTVMSRLARARTRLQDCVAKRFRRARA